MKRAVTVFAPHPDDETIACGGMIAQATARGDEVSIVILTDGRYSHKSKFKIWPNPRTDRIRAIRKREAIKAADVLGVKMENIHFMDFEDGTLVQHMSEAGEFVKLQLNKWKPTEVYVPYSGDAHTDHAATNEIVLTAVSELGLSMHLYEYIVWQQDESELPYVFGQPNAVTLDIPDVLEIKMQALKMYKSQIETRFPSHIWPVLDEAFLSSLNRGVEYFLKFRIENGKQLQ